VRPGVRARARLKRWRYLALEAGGTLFLVLALFCFFLLLLYGLFPSATPLRELIRSSLEPAAPPVEKRAEATLSALMRDVRFRRGNSIAWRGASAGMPLYSQDAVQTFDSSGATISFGASDQLAVGSNSLVMVTRLNAREEAGPRSYRVQVEGELRGNFSAARKLQLEFAAAGHLARVKPGAARFKISPNDDNSASLSVYSGELQIDGGGRVRVPANYGVTLKEGRAVGKAVPLPPAPQLSGPQPAIYRYRILPPRVHFAWQGAAGEYRFQLSRDARFEHILADQRLDTREFVTGKLTLGNYFWRVSAIEKGAESVFSSTGRCELSQLLAAPALSVQFPPESSPAGPYTLSGRAVPGARIFVDGVETAAQAGGFAHQGVIKPGVNLIRVEAIDPAGNASYASRIVYGRL
jgi:hypothetical protein